MEPNVATLSRDIERETMTLKRVEAELRRVIVGQDYLLDRLLVGLLSRGHVLIEGVPGLAKTLAVKTLAQTLAIDFQRIQFTPDLLPADLVGTLIYDQRTAEAVLRAGHADLVAFGVPFIANPDLVERFAEGAPLAAGDRATFYGGDGRGYADYPERDGTVRTLDAPARQAAA
jgi:MoxR-like ATPase